MSKKKSQPKPPPRRSPAYRLVDEPGLVELTFRISQFAVAGFLSVFLIGWSVGCAFLIWRVSADPKPAHLAFAVPFLVGWLFAFLALVNCLFGRERLRLDARGLRFAHRLGFEYGVVEFPPDELIGCGTATQDDESDHRPAARVLEVRTLGKPIRCGSAATDEERSALASLVGARIRELQEQERTPPRLAWKGAPIVFGRRLGGELLGEGDALRTSTDPPIPPPADTRWRSTVEFDAVTFAHAGRWMPGGIFGVLLINLFWSTIVGFFYYQLFGGDPNEQPHGLEWLWQFLFLIPFSLVGLFMFLGLAAMLLEPVRRYRWRFERERAICKLSWLGLGPSWRMPLGSVDRLEVRRRADQKTKPFTRFPLGTLWAPKGCPTFTLAVVDAHRRDLCTVEGLTLGEACHWADLLARSQTHWFT